MYNNEIKKYWTGRTDSIENRASFRLHQIVKSIASDEVIKDAYDVAFVGFECDEGVRRNKGRLGASEGPNAIRQSMSSLPHIFDENVKIADIGNVQCQGTALEEAQIELGNHVSNLLVNNTKCIVLGGGHETLYGHYLGVRQAVGEDQKIGIVNIDAHFDLRDYDEQPSSGTMFKQILDDDVNASYFVCGIQRYGNTVELFERADDLGVTYLYEDEMTVETVETAFNDFSDKCDVILLTLCTDVLDAACAPGVSAPSPFGMHPKEVRSIIRFVTTNQKTTSFNICEVNPSLDPSGITVKLGAQLTNEAMVGLIRGK